ncbi:GTP cyclohydrolase FolE2 [Methylophilus methylotrophus]|uniref:GTP cyclohydrolase FolE2 n=1 Tax=Methylophilus methylotrophus TaxID=17 RepID=UPI00035E1601|nr:GTP cyclohydrolase FolE2 [Methylophilus methylotrophus]
MNSPVPFPIEDVQNLADVRQLAINKVGIKAIRHPIKIKDKAGIIQGTIATMSMYVQLPQHLKGTHMSRFIEILNHQEHVVSLENFYLLLHETALRLEAKSGYIEMEFPYFVNKAAPVSGVKSLLDYQVTFIGEISESGCDVKVKILIPVTSLCPCSKKISAYGAHNQRSHVTVTLSFNTLIWLEDIIRLVELQASSELYGLLKRPDEKYVTELAYDNPKFVEDMVRDIASVFYNEARIKDFIVECENFESIHNHSAYACITSLDI